MLFTKAYWVNMLEAVVTTFAASFAGYLAATTSTPSVHSIEVAAYGAAIQALYQCSKAIGGTQVLTTLKALAPGPSTTAPPPTEPPPAA